MLELGLLKTFDSETHTAGVQLAGSLTTYLDNISVSVSIPSSAMVVGNYVLVAIPGGNPRDACIVASWPAGSSGGGGGSKIQDADGDTWIDVEKNADEDHVRMGVAGVEAFDLDNNGIRNLPKQSAARGYLPSNQSIDGGGDNYLIQLSGISYDIQNEWDTTNYRYVASTPGRYLVIARARWISCVTGYRFKIALYKNNDLNCLNNYHASNYDTLTMPLATIVSLDENDYLDLRAGHMYTSPLSLRGTEAHTNMAVYKLG